MLDLNPGVHLHEIEVAGAIHQELHGAGALVADGAGCGDGGLAHAPAQFGVDGHARGFLEQLLVTPLNGAVPLPDMDHVSVAVGQHLHLNVPGPVDELLHVEAGVAEGGFRFPLGGLEEVVQLVR